MCPIQLFVEVLKKTLFFNVKRSFRFALSVPKVCFSPPSGASLVVAYQTYNTISKHTIMTTLKKRLPVFSIRSRLASHTT
jgi:hypothetical protein